MTKCRIKFSTDRTFDSQSDARAYLKGLIAAGVLFIKCSCMSDGTKVSANEMTYFQTQSEAKDSLKILADAGILYLEVEKGWGGKE